jgi:group I intron endonuclease
MKTTFIYALKCPLMGEIRYIGKSDNPKERFRKHITRSFKKSNHRECWIQSLLESGKKPELEILDEVNFEFWASLEAAYIQFYTELGFPLVNSTLGGEGITFSTEIRAKMSAAMVGNKRWFGKTLSEEHRKKISIAKKNPSEGTREKMSRSAKIRKEREAQEKILSEMWR